MTSLKLKPKPTADLGCVCSLSEVRTSHVKNMRKVWSLHIKCARERTHVDGYSCTYSYSNLNSQTYKSTLTGHGNVEKWWHSNVSYGTASLRWMSPASLFWFWIRKWAQSFVLRLYTIIYVFFRLYTSYFSSSPSGGGWGHAIPFSDFGFENGLNRLYFVCTRLYTTSFVCTLLTFLPPLEGGEA